MNPYNNQASYAAAVLANKYIQRGMLPLWTIYAHPLDFPEHFVVRVFVVGRSGEPKMQALGVVCCSLEEAREQVPLYCTVLKREAADDPAIVETWL